MSLNGSECVLINVRNWSIGLMKQHYTLQSVNNLKSTVESSLQHCDSQNVSSTQSQSSHCNLDTACTGTSSSNHAPPSRLSILDRASTSSNHPPPSTASTSSNYPPPSRLSIGANESGLNLHKEVLSGTWEKAEKLTDLEWGLQPAASSDSSA